MKIYLAGPISGKSADDVYNRIQTVSFRLKLFGYEVQNPMTGKGHLRTEKEFVAKDYRHPVATNHAIIERDRWMVKRSDVVFANLMDAEEKSIGTIMELAWAHDNGVHTVVAMPETGPHNHAFIIETADILFHNAEDAIQYLRLLVQDE